MMNRVFVGLFLVACFFMLGVVWSAMQGDIERAFGFGVGIVAVVGLAVGLKWLLSRGGGS